jgi:flagellum-specific ATP synthase
LLERAGASDVGAITGLYTVLVEGDDFNEPIADLVRGLLDGHVVLSRALAQQNHFPSIDVGQSVSRLFLALATPQQRQAVANLRDLMALYQKNEDLMSVGAYVPGHNARLDLAVALKPKWDEFLRQAVEENIPYAETLSLLCELAAVS